MTDMRTIVFACLLSVAGSASAQIYRWVDSQGRVNFSNSTPPQGVQATVVDANARAAPPSADSQDCYTIRCQGERMEERQRKRDSEDAIATADRAAVDAMAFDEIEDEIRRLPDEGERGLANPRPPCRDQIVRRGMEARDHLSARLTRGSPARHLGLEHRHARAAFGQMERRRQAGQARADDDNVGGGIVERRERGSRRSGHRPERLQGCRILAHAGSRPRDCRASEGAPRNADRSKALHAKSAAVGRPGG